MSVPEPTPSAIGITGSAEIDTVLVGHTRRLRVGKAAVILDGLVEMRAGRHQGSEMQLAESHRHVSGDESRGVVRPVCPIEKLFGGHQGICVIPAAHLKQPNANQYRTDAVVVADRRAQLPCPAESVARFGRGIAFGGKARLAERPLQCEFLPRALWCIGELRQLGEAGHQVSGCLQVG